MTCRVAAQLNIVFDLPFSQLVSTCMLAGRQLQQQRMAAPRRRTSEILFLIFLIYQHCRAAIAYLAVRSNFTQC